MQIYSVEQVHHLCMPTLNRIQSPEIKLCLFNLNIRSQPPPDIHVSLCIIFLLTSSFAALITTTATRGHRPTRNVDLCCHKLLPQSTFGVISWWGRFWSLLLALRPPPSWYFGAIGDHMSTRGWSWQRGPDWILMRTRGCAVVATMSITELK